MKPKHQEHFRGPASETLHRRQPLDHFVVRQALERIKVQPTVDDPGGEIPQIANLLTTQPDAAQGGIVEPRDGFSARHGVVGEERGESTEDRRCGLGGQLLTDDGARQCGEMIVMLTPGHATWSEALDGDGEDWIAAHQQSTRAGVVGWGHGSWTGLWVEPFGRKGTSPELKLGPIFSAYFSVTVRVTRARISIVPGSTGVSTAATAAEARVRSIAIGRGIDGG